MACYHPIVCWQAKCRDPTTGKRPAPIFKDPWDDVHYDEIQVPCGQCIGCRLDYSRDWATRIMHEADLWPNNYFLTLTYSDENLPSDFNVHRERLQKFMKDLRRYYKYHFDHDEIRFYGVGEYGENSARPHYHVCVFNLPIPDLVYYKSNELGQALYTSEILERVWSAGFVVVGDLTWDSAAYVARYMMKKLKGKDAKEVYQSLGIEPEFSAMSRMPGIGRAWYDLHKDEMYKFDEVFLKSNGRIRALRPARYYDRLYSVENLDYFEDLKLKRLQTAREANKMKMSKTSLWPSQQLEVEERTKLDQRRKLIRNFERSS